MYHKTEGPALCYANSYKIFLSLNAWYTILHGIRSTACSRLEFTEWKTSAFTPSHHGWIKKNVVRARLIGCYATVNLILASETSNIEGGLYFQFLRLVSYWVRDLNEFTPVFHRFSSTCYELQQWYEIFSQRGTKVRHLFLQTKLKL